MLCVQFCSAQRIDFSKREIFMSNEINRKFISFTNQSEIFLSPILSKNKATSFRDTRAVSEILNPELKSNNKKAYLNTHLDFAPAILSEAILHSSKANKSHFAFHMEVAHEFHLGKIGIEPFIEISFEQEVRHLGVGIQLGITL